jgi:hypothetical protein
MSVENNSLQPASGTGAEPTGEGTATTVAPVAELQLFSDSIGLELVRLLAETRPADVAADATGSAADAPVYDGHVALALDTDVLPDIDATLDMLTSSHQLFDVPALDVGNVVDDSLPS